MALQSSPGLIFLSHSGADTQDAKALASALRQAGLDVWLDADCLKPGDVWSNELEQALQKATAFVLYVGELGVLKWVGRDARYALIVAPRIHPFDSSPSWAVVPQQRHSRRS